MDDDRLDRLLQDVGKIKSQLDGDLGYLKQGQDDLKGELQKTNAELKKTNAELKKTNDRLDSQEHTLKVIKNIVMSKTADVAAER